jgi:filamentous hemagglutinin family protein
LLLATSILVSQGAWAAPQSGSVVSGQATITQSGNTLNIVQQSAKLVINWQSFSIGAGETVRITQPSAQSSILNQVTGGAMSVLNGQLLANGIVFIVNPAGISVGSSGRIAVGGLVATTSSIATSDFLANRYIFAAAPGGGAVTNAGVISAASGGAVILAATQVENTGRIEAPLGSVALGAAKSFNVDVNGDGLLRYQVGEAAVGAVVRNGGTISASGGQILISARSVDAVTRDVINVGGVVEANSVSTRNGEIIFDGGSSGIVSVTGQVQAQGLNAGETGGTVKLLGETVGIMDGARVDASGQAGGGTILAGGNWHGEGAEPHANVTYLAQSAVLAADATQSGNGGQVVLWSDVTTRAYGTISVRGGASGGNGGAVETSSKGFLDFAANIDRSAVAGKAGSLLLDPLDFSINHGGGGSNNMGGSPLAPTGGSATITDGQIATLLAGGAVSLQTGAGGNITMNNNAFINAPGATNSLTISSGGTYTGQLGSQITTGGAVSISAQGAMTYGTATTVAGNLTLSGASVVLGNAGTPTIRSTGGNISVTATQSAIGRNANVVANVGTVTYHDPAGAAGNQLPPPPPPPPPPFGGGGLGRVGPGLGGQQFGPPLGAVVGAADLFGSGSGSGLAAGPGATGESAFGAPQEGEGRGTETGAPPGGGRPGGMMREPPPKGSVATVIPGLLAREVPPPPGGNQDVPGVSQRYSTFGNPALW